MARRRYVQALSALLYNANLFGFARGTLYTGNLKGLCVPGLNCHSCPGAIAACPLGSLQTALGDIKTKLPLYIVGTLLLFAVLLGRFALSFVLLGWSKTYYIKSHRRNCEKAK